MIDTRDYEMNRYLFFATAKGRVKRTKFTAYDSSRKAGLIAISLRDGDELVAVVPTDGVHDVLLSSRRGQTLRFAQDQVREMGRTAAGVIGLKFKHAGDSVVSCAVTRPDATLLYVTTLGYGKRTAVDEFRCKGRGGKGIIGVRLVPGKGDVMGTLVVDPDDEILAVTGQRRGDPHPGGRHLRAEPGGIGREGDEPRRRRPGGGDRPRGRGDERRRRRHRRRRWSGRRHRAGQQMTGRARPELQDRGQAAPMMVVVLVAAVAVAVVAAEVGRLLDEGARAQTASDAAALAGAAAGRDEAALIAAANDGVLLSYTEDASDAAGVVVVTVSVKVGRAARTARAEGLVEWLPPG